MIPRTLLGVSASRRRPIVLPVVGDDNIDKVAALLHGNGANNSTTVADSSLYGAAFVASGAAKISTVSSKFGGSSLYFDGSGSTQVGNTNKLAQFQFGTGDFTIEFWLNLAVAVSGNPPTIVDLRLDGDPPNNQMPVLYCPSAGTLSYHVAGDRISGAMPNVPGQWMHIAVSRVSGNTRLFVDGTQIGTTYPDTGNYTSNVLRIGSNYIYNSTVDGYIDDFRLTVGVGRYTANFTPPTAEFSDTSLPGGPTDDLQAHRYWSLEMLGTPPVGSFSLFELQMRNTIGGSNIAPGNTPIGLATTIGGGTLSFDKAVDGNAATRYVTDNGLAGWAGVDFGTPVRPAEYAIVGSSGYNTLVNPTAWKFRYSDDGVEWVTVDERSGQTWADGEVKSRTVPQPVAPGYRYWSMKITGVSNAAGVNVHTMHMATSVGGANIALTSLGGRTPIGTTGPGGSAYGPVSAFDNNTATVFDAGNTSVGAYLGMDFGAPVSIREYGLGGNNPAYVPTNWEFRYSDDGVNWVVVDTRSGQSFPTSTLVKYEVPVAGGVTWPVSVGATSILSADPNYASCRALLHGTGANAGTNFIDQIGNLWAANGNAQTSTASPNYGSSSMLFDGTGDYLSASIANPLGTGNFTIRGKIKIVSLASDGEIFCIGDTSNTSAFDLVLEYKATGALRFSIQDGSGNANADITTATGLLAINTLYDFAVVADGSTARIYIDGVQRQSGAITGTRVQNRTDCRIGYLASAVPRWMNARLNGLQIYNGVCLYPSGTTFTPPTNADRPSLPALTYVSSFATSATTVSDAQGVADDGTNLYYSNSTTLFKYSKAGALVTSRSTTGDAPTPRTQINGLFHRNGILYVSAAYYSGGVGASYIAEYDPTTLAPLGVVHTLDVAGLSNSFSEGLAWYGGFWWVAFHSDRKVGVYSADFSTRVALLDLDFPLTGSSGGYGTGQGYDGIAWWGDYMLCNVHEIYDQKFLDVYTWNGTTLSKVSRISRSRTVESQGLAVDPSDTTVLRFAERNYSGNDGVAKRQFV